LSKEEDFRRTGTDWLLILLDKTNKVMHQAILLLLWRSWHLRNDICHAKRDATIEQSARFLRSYVHNLNANPSKCVVPVYTDTKGKIHAHEAQYVEVQNKKKPHANQIR
jgi:hypothetical protein